MADNRSSMVKVGGLLQTVADWSGMLGGRNARWQPWKKEKELPESISTPRN
jgi:hypothetical protein